MDSRFWTLDSELWIMHYGALEGPKGGGRMGREAFRVSVSAGLCDELVSCACARTLQYARTQRGGALLERRVAMRMRGDEAGEKRLRCDVMCDEMAEVMGNIVTREWLNLLGHRG